MIQFKGRFCNHEVIYFVIHFITLQSRNNQWASCPEGYFLQGVYRSSDIWLHNIEQALCCKPRNFETMHMNVDCYNEDVKISLDKGGLSKCKKDWYYIVGLYRGGCKHLSCIEYIKCCTMRPPGTHSQTFYFGNYTVPYKKPL